MTPTQPQLPGCLPPGFDKFSMLTPLEFSIWKRIPLRSANAQFVSGLPGVVCESRKDKKILVLAYLEQRAKIKIE